MRCPRDKMPLENTESEGVMIDICTYCDGVWLDNSELSRITGMKSDTLDGDKITGDVEWDEVLTCPVCSVKMEKRYFAKTDDLKVDKCPQCRGIWLDTGEMRLALEICYKIKEAGQA